MQGLGLLQCKKQTQKEASCVTPRTPFIVDLNSLLYTDDALKIIFPNRFCLFSMGASRNGIFVILFPLRAPFLGHLSFLCVSKKIELSHRHTGAISLPPRYFSTCAFIKYLIKVFVCVVKTFFVLNHYKHKLIKDGKNQYVQNNCFSGQFNYNSNLQINFVLY